MTTRRRPEDQPPEDEVSETAIQAVLAIIGKKEPRALSIVKNILESGRPDLIEHVVWGMVEHNRQPKYVQPRESEIGRAHV